MRHDARHPRKVLKGASLRRLARQVQKLTELSYCKALDAVSRAAGFRHWPHFTTSNGLRLSSDELRAGLSREFGPDVAIQLDEALIEDCSYEHLPPPQADLTSADMWALQAAASRPVRGSAGAVVRAFVVGSSDIKCGESSIRSLAYADGKAHQAAERVPVVVHKRVRRNLAPH